MTQPMDEMEKFIHEAFEHNYERLRQETGHALSPYTRELAFTQILMYWRKLKTLAESVTETEVHLNLPGQKTPAGREYNIDGVVDILREGDTVTMYDIKTHDPDYVRNNIGLYHDQMNVYAHIWQKLRSQQLDKMSIIATRLPHALRQALGNGDEVAMLAALEDWKPEVPIEMSAAAVTKTVEEFAKVVDNIEDGKFCPADLKTLKEPMGHRGKPFATQVCMECDARFSCSSFRKYQGLKKGERGKATTFYGAQGNVEEQNERLNAGLK